MAGPKARVKDLGNEIWDIALQKQVNTKGFAFYLDQLFLLLLESWPGDNL